MSRDTAQIERDKGERLSFFMKLILSSSSPSKIMTAELKASY